MTARSRPLRRSGALAAPILAAAVLVFVLLNLSPRASQGAGPYSLDGVLATVNISFGGTCNPGNLTGPLSMGSSQTPTPVAVAVSGSVANCISRAGCPEAILIQNLGDPTKYERFSYANVSALTLDQIATTSSFPFILAAENLPPAPDPAGHCLGQADFPGNFAPSGPLLIDHELFTYDSIVPDPTTGQWRFRIVSRAGNAQHPAGSLIRAENRIELLSEAFPKYPGSSSLTPTPTFASHSTGSTVRSPKTYNTCRVLLSQPAGGSNPVQATSACFFIQEPGYNETLCATPAVPAPAGCFWPVGGMAGDYRGSPVQYWSSTSVQEQMTQTTVDLVANVFPSIDNCFPYVQGLFYAKMHMTITLAKSGKSYSGGTGTFATDIYKDSQCAASVVYTLTDSSPNVGAAPAPSMFLKCAVDVQASAHALCYINSLTTTNNKPAAGSASCPPANAKFCGDAIFAPPGCSQASQLPVPVACLALPAATPSRHDCAGLGSSTDPSTACDVSQYQYLHVDKSMSLTVAGDSSTKTLLTNGCIQDPHGHQPLGAVYISSMTIDPRTGSGSATIYTNQPSATCSGSPIGGGPQVVPVQVTIERSKTAGANAVLCDGGSGHPQPMPGTTNQCRNGDSFGTCFDPANVATTYCRDSDGDGCFDKDELNNNEGTQTNVDAAKYGGLRDPQNPYDYPDMPIPSNKHKIRVDDVTYVVNRFRHDMNLMPAPSSNPYDPKADHIVLPGNNAGETWHLGPPNGQVRVDDVTAVVNSFRHDCN